MISATQPKSARYSRPGSEVLATAKSAGRAKRRAESDADDVHHKAIVEIDNCGEQLNSEAGRSNVLNRPNRQRVFCQARRRRKLSKENEWSPH